MEANKTCRDMVLAALAGIDGHIADIATERGLTLKPIAKVYRYGSPDGKPLMSEFPNVEVTPPEATVSVQSTSATFDCAMWVMVSVSLGSRDEADAACEAYLSALLRTLVLREDAAATMEVTDFDTSPPLPTGQGNAMVQTVGVKVAVRLTESLP